MMIFNSLESLQAAAGTHLGKSQWRTVTQQDVNTFADLTGDHQWIHVDVERAKQSSFGSTVAHGFLTLSLIPVLAEEVYCYQDFTMSLNYGSNRLRFPSSVPVGSRIRGSFDLAAVSPIPIGHLVQVNATVEIENAEKPACFLEFLVALVP